MLSHANITTTVIASTPRIPGLEDKRGKAKTLSFLPVVTAERFIQYLYMYNGASIYFRESRNLKGGSQHGSTNHLYGRS